MRAFMHWVNEYDESIQTRVALFLCLTYKLFGRYSDFFVFFLSTKLEQIYPFWFLPNIRGLIRCEKELFVFWTQNHYKLRGMNSQIWTDIFFFTQIQSFSNLEWINVLIDGVICLNFVFCINLTRICNLFFSFRNYRFVIRHEVIVVVLLVTAINFCSFLHQLSIQRYNLHMYWIKRVHTTICML